MKSAPNVSIGSATRWLAERGRKVTARGELLPGLSAPDGADPDDGDRVMEKYRLVPRTSKSPVSAGVRLARTFSAFAACDGEFALFGRTIIVASNWTAEALRPSSKLPNRQNEILSDLPTVVRTRGCAREKTSCIKTSPRKIDASPHICTQEGWGVVHTVYALQRGAVRLP